MNTKRLEGRIILRPEGLNEYSTPGGANNTTCKQKTEKGRPEGLNQYSTPGGVNNTTPGGA